MSKDIARLLAQLDEQKERIRQLEESLGFHLRSPLELNLTPSQAAIFGCLYVRPIANRETLIQAHEVTVGCNRDSDPKVIDVQMVHLRKKLRPHGVEVKTIWGQGYTMPAASKLRVREMFVEESARQAAITAQLMMGADARPPARNLATGAR
jgi:two-component system cell cycle response regulator CtrA